jgi:hypothetical protein
MQEQCSFSILENCSVTLGLLKFKILSKLLEEILPVFSFIDTFFQAKRDFEPLGANLVFAVHETI